MGSSADKLVSFYDGDSTPVLIATVIFGFATLCLMWFAAALASVLRGAGRGGWGTAATAAGAAIGAVYFVRITFRAGLAYSIAGSGNDQVTSALNDVSWAVVAIGWFPICDVEHGRIVRALASGDPLYSGVRGGSDGHGARLLGTTTWASDGFWALDRAYARFIPTIVMLLWFAVVSGFLAMQSPSAVKTPDHAAVPAA